MRRYSEAVLNGHPDKFCDLIADRIVMEAYKTDPDACTQVEVAVWSDLIFLTGGLVTRKKPHFDVNEIIRKVGNEIGYTNGNYIDVERYKILDHMCRISGNPKRWTDYSNDQSIVVGYAGYDAQTQYLPPEHFLAWYFREALINSLENGLLINQGPDGKLLIIMDETTEGFCLKQILVTLQQQESASFIEMTENVAQVLFDAYTKLRSADHRWVNSWKNIRLLINPNGPLLNGGSDGDNGQTGRKLVMDYYGPRIPIGGGALYGKDLSHIDRLGAFSARKLAVDLMKDGAKEVTVKVCFAPGMDEPLAVDLSTNRSPGIDLHEYFRFSEMKKRIDLNDINYNSTNLGTFYNPDLSFNN